MRYKIVTVAMLGLFLSGCGSTQITCVKPSFPNPSQHTLSKIQGLDDTEVDLWMEELFKLNKKLKEEN